MSLYSGSSKADTSGSVSLSTGVSEYFECGSIQWTAVKSQLGAGGVVSVTSGSDVLVSSDNSGCISLSSGRDISATTRKTSDVSG